MHRYLFSAIWISWALYWWVQSRQVRANVWRESLSSRLLHIIPLLVAALLLWLPSISVAGLNERFVPLAWWLYWVGFALTLCGIFFSVLARKHLGRNWSATVTIKHDHELVQSGPYAYVRHPIYTGLLLAFVGSAIALGEWRGVVAVVLVTVALWRKLRVEERGMQQQFGEEYLEYSRKVAALIPFIL
ncbi:MAG: hypothetical protein JWN23_2921 [Rhodocyclales bacterium]|nr:hypothetical protein [Rhodocyclales bacterium]